jgi:site-specific DNA-adenine methylase
MSLGIPYMGSKRKLAPEILKLITSRHQNITDFYDLCGGGGSISFNAIKDYRFNVHYNELNSHIFYLVKYLKENKTLEPRFYEWVTREMFFEQINKTNEEADWYSGFVMSCWSFGNSQSSYLYGSEIEELKRLAHEFIVYGCKDSMLKLNIDIPQLNNIHDLQKRRIIFSKYVKNVINKVFDRGVQSLEMVEHLSRIQNLQNLQITNGSYENVIITGDNPILYLDVPYKGTGEYKEGGFDHDRFYDWFANIPYPAYLSEYNAPFECVERFTHRSSLSATNNKKKTIESIFWNGKGEIYNTKLF